ncbi:shieldin complex subunit 2 isoform X2 [Festucalex cinctus]
MCERPKVHVFLGAPGPSPSRVRPLRRRRLELTWREGRLVPAADEDGATQEEEISHEESTRGRRASPLQESSQPEARLSFLSRALSTWTLSQALFLRGVRPPPGTERLSDASGSSPGGAARRAERGGVVMEATPDGVLCSQADGRGVSSPARKSARPGDGRDGASTTLLAQCADAATRYRVLVVVLHPCQLKEIKVKRGSRAGSPVALASVVVTDQSGVDVTVLLWRRAAFWAAALAAGDLLLITGLQLSQDTWRGQKVLQSTFSSKLLNLGHISAPTRPTGGRRVDAVSVSSLRDFLAERRPLLLSAPPRPPPDLRRLPYAPLWLRRENTLVHALLRVTHAYVSAEWRAEAESWRRSALERHAVASVVGAGGQKGALLMWGSAADWLPRFRTHRDAVWDVRFLLVRESRWSADLPELHTTPWSRARRVDAADPRLARFLCAADGGGGGVEMDVDTLLSQQYSGEALLRVQVLAFAFQPSPDGPRPILDASTPLRAVAGELSGDVTYSGCGRCAAELDADADGIYAPCYPCLPARHVRRFYRPAVLTVSGASGGGGRVRVHVPAVAVQKIVDVPPDRLLRNSVAGGEVKGVQVAAEKLHALLGPPGKKALMAVRSLFLCDDNSAPISRELTMLDLRLLPHDG